MTYDLRQPLDYKFGTISAGVTALDTTIQSAAFTSLPSTPSTTQYIPVELADDSQGIYEVVWVTGHTANSTSVTVVRAREGTTARAWSSGAIWRITPTTRDTLPTLTRATLPSDAHLGMRVQLSDEMQVVEKAINGWITPLGNGTARKSVWKQDNSGCPINTLTNISGLTAVSGQQNAPCTFSSGVLTLQRSGFWALWLGLFWDDGRAKWASLQFNWANGAMPVNPNLRSYAPGGYSGAGQINTELQWVGYVTAAQAANPITLQVTVMTADSTVVSSGLYYTAWAEYLGG